MVSQQRRPSRHNICCTQPGLLMPNLTTLALSIRDQKKFLLKTCETELEPCCNQGVHNGNKRLGKKCDFSVHLLVMEVIPQDLENSQGLWGPFSDFLNTRRSSCELHRQLSHFVPHVAA